MVVIFKMRVVIYLKPKTKIMLGKIVKDKERERQEYHNKLVEYHNSELVKMEKLKAELEKLGDGYLKLKIKFGDKRCQKL